MSYYKDLDRYHATGGDPTAFERGQGDGLSKPITPISKLGATFSDRTKGDVLKSMVASIRQGSGKLQLALGTPMNQAMGRPFTSWSKSMKQAIKEAIKTSGVEFAGVELPTSSNTNMSGWDGQQSFSEQKRQTDLTAVKQAIDFVAEIGTGGGIDVWSQEYARGIGDRFTGEDGQQKLQEFEGWKEDHDAVKYLVDERTGRMMGFQTSQIGQGGKVTVPVFKTAHQNYVDKNGVMVESGDYIDNDGNKITGSAQDIVARRVPEWDDATKSFATKSLDWNEFKNYAQERNKHEGANYSPEEWFYRVQTEGQYVQTKAQAMQYSQQLDKMMQERQKLQEAREFYAKMEQGKDKDELMRQNLLVPSQQPMTQGGTQLPPEYRRRSEVLAESIEEIDNRLRANSDISSQYNAQAENIWQGMESIKKIDNFAKDKTTESYAELGMYAYDQSQRHDVKKAIHVGPELGWPQAYGGHTDEFIEIIENSRKKMIEKMEVDDRFRNKSPDELKKIANKHIGGMMDTSHLSMWYNHFPKEHPNESEDQRLKRFNKWYMQQIGKLKDAGVVAGIQVVDAATGEHAHLPPGEGIFPVIDATKELMDGNPDLEVVSEGHNMEETDPGKIQYSLWNAFGASMGSHPGTGAPASFGNVYGGNGGAAGYRAPPNYIVGGYAPSNEWKLWTEVPLE